MVFNKLWEDREVNLLIVGHKNPFRKQKREEFIMTNKRFSLFCPAASPTVPPLHSEHFKPCHEKDLAYCLNGGECFVIETLSGPHKHCK